MMNNDELRDFLNQNSSNRPKPARRKPKHFIERTQQDNFFNTMSIEEIAQIEIAEAQRNRTEGLLDMRIGASLVPASIFLEVLQSEREKLGDSFHAGNAHVLNFLSSLSVDWKGVAVASGAMAITGGVRRATQPITTNRDLAKAQKEANSPSTIEFTPHTRESYDKFRRHRKFRQACTTALATIGGYSLGTRLNVEQSLVPAALFTGLAGTKVAYEHARSNAAGRAL